MLDCSDRTSAEIAGLSIGWPQRSEGEGEPGRREQTSGGRRGLLSEDEAKVKKPFKGGRRRVRGWREGQRLPHEHQCIMQTAANLCIFVELWRSVVFTQPLPSQSIPPCVSSDKSNTEVTQMLPTTEWEIQLNTYFSNTFHIYTHLCVCVCIYI